MSIAAYPSYTSSGIEWLGMVPAGWEIKPLKLMADFINGEAFKPSDWSDQGTPIIRIQNLNGGDEFNFYAGEVADKYHVRMGDLLFGWSGNRGTSFGPFIWRRHGIFYLNQHIFKILPIGCDPAWLHWCLRAVTLYVEQQAHGIIGMVHITKGALGAVPIPVPHLSVQRAIASFLDRETAKIDALVAEKERLIAILNEKRQAVITQGVTKGLNPDVPMKPSGVEWLGEVPAHWRVGSLSRIATRVVVGIAEAAVHAYAETGVPILRSMNVRAGEIIGDLLYVDPRYAADRETKMIRAGDLLTVRTGHAGVTVVIPPELDGCQCFTMLVTTLESGHVPEYYCDILNSNGGREYFATEAWGSAQPNISVPILKATPVPIPPEQEQHDIVVHLETTCGQFDDLTAEATEAIALLQERRSALISAAVTGKIDVRHLVPTEAEQATAA